MQWLFGIIAGVGFVELMQRLPLLSALAKYKSTAAKSVSVLRSKAVSDHWKEKVLLKYALQLLTLTAALALLVLAAFAPVLLLWTVAVLAEIPFPEFAMSWTGIAFITTVAAGYARIRSACAPARL